MTARPPTCTRCESALAFEDLRCPVCLHATDTGTRIDAPVVAVEVMRCSSCGASVTYSVREMAPSCAFCGSVTRVEVPADPIEQTELYLPFAFPRDRAAGRYREWLKGIGWFRPSDLGATSADHLLYATAEDIDALTDAGVVPVLLPGTAFGLGAEFADARAFLDADAPVAIATDFNPNCHSQSMSFASSLACVDMGMTPAEALVAGTKHAAMALDIDDGTGTLQPGSPADVAVIDAPNYVHVPYTFGVNTVESVLFVRTERLRQWVKTQHYAGRPWDTAGTNGSCPTRGYWVPVGVLAQWMADRRWEVAARSRSSAIW